MTTNVSTFGQGTLKLGATDHICQIQGAVMRASNNRQDVVTACGTTTTFVNERFDFLVRFVQDWTSAGISNYLWDHYNQDVTFEFSPDPDGTPKLTGTVTCPRPSMGGDALQPLVDDLVIPVVGTPTKTVDV